MEQTDSSAREVLLFGPLGSESANYELSRDLDLRVYEPQEDQLVTVAVPIGKGADLAGNILVTLEKGEGRLRVLITKSSIETNLNLASIRLFSSKYRFSGSDDNVFRVDDGERNDFAIQIEECRVEANRLSI